MIRIDDNTDVQSLLEVEVDGAMRSFPVGYIPRETQIGGVEGIGVLQNRVVAIP